MRQIYSRHLTLTTGVLVVALVAAFALAQSPEILESPRLAAVTAGRPLPHPVAGYEDCQGCHGREGMRPYPPDHWGWSDQSCTRCHATPAPTGSTRTRPGGGATGG